MFAFFFSRRARCCWLVALAISPCFWPIYRYSVESPRKLIDSEGARLLPDRPSVEFDRVESRAIVYFERFRWEDEAREKFGGQTAAGVGENSFLDDKHLRFRRHNLSVSIHMQSRGPLTETEKSEMVRLAKTIDQRIQNLDGTRLSVDTFGNKAFQTLIKPMFEMDRQPKGILRRWASLF